MSEINFFQGNLADLVNLLTDRVSQTEPLAVDFLNIHGYGLNLTDDLFASCQRDIDIVVRDGVGLQLFRRWLGISEIGYRIPGPSFFEFFFDATNDAKHLFLGGSSETQELMREKYSGARNIRVIPVGKLHYGRDSMEVFAENILGEVHEFQPRYVWIGLGCPKQNVLASVLKAKIQCNAIICVGAAFSYHVGLLPNCPNLLRQLGFESFWRFCSEPKKIFSRILTSVLSIIRNADS